MKKPSVANEYSRVKRIVGPIARGTITIFVHQNRMQSPPRIAVVVPIYNEQENIPELCRRIREACGELNDVRWEAIFVDDGSTDDSAVLLRKEAQSCTRIRLIRLSRNFGHQPAISAGLFVCDADAAVVMDGDLQDPPEVIPQLVERWQSGAKVVRAERLSRRESGLRRLAFAAFHRFFNLFSDFPIPANSGVFCLLDRDVIRIYNSLSERHRYFPGLSAWIGFRQETVCYHRDERYRGQPKQSWRRLASYALDALCSFSYVPLRLVTYAGFFISAMGFSIGLFFAMRRILGVEIAFTGFTTIVVLILFIGGLQLMALGIIGEYLGRMYDEAKRRPYFIIDESEPAHERNLSDNRIR